MKSLQMPPPPPTTDAKWWQMFTWPFGPGELTSVKKNIAGLIYKTVFHQSLP
jgi:hypothetical protein